MDQAKQSCCVSEWQRCRPPRYTSVKPPTFNVTLIGDDRRPACNQTPTNVTESRLSFPSLNRERRTWRPQVVSLRGTVVITMVTACLQQLHVSCLDLVCKDK